MSNVLLSVLGLIWLTVLALASTALKYWLVERHKSAVSAKRVTYSCSDNGDIILPDHAPFDGKTVLVRFPAGWCEAWWDDGGWTETLDGREYSGFEWVCLDDHHTEELDNASYWMPLPVILNEDGTRDTTCEHKGEDEIEVPDGYVPRPLRPHLPNLLNYATEKKARVRARMAAINDEALRDMSEHTSVGLPKYSPKQSEAVDVNSVPPLRPLLPSEPSKCRDTLSTLLNGPSHGFQR